MVIVVIAVSCMKYSSVGCQCLCCYGAGSAGWGVVKKERRATLNREDGNMLNTNLKMKQGHKVNTRGLSTAHLLIIEGLFRTF